MMKLYDFDGMFDQKLAKYISENAGKYREEEWEDIIARLYREYGDTYLKLIGDTPNGFYAKMSDGELVSALKIHLKKGIPVPVFLCNAIEKRDCAGLLLPLLDGSEDEVEYAVNLIGSDERALDRYMQMLVSADTSEDIKNRCVDALKEKADLVAERAAGYYAAGTEKDYMLEILSRTVKPSDEVFYLLLNAFLSADDKSLTASYLASYGDARALDALYAAIEDEGIPFAEFQELKYAIEALGGEYEDERDFSGDPYYEMIKSGSRQAYDIFGAFGDKKQD